LPQWDTGPDADRLFKDVPDDETDAWIAPVPPGIRPAGTPRGTDREVRQRRLPPYNIEQRGENAYRITLAVAGFGEGDLSITVEDRQLVVRGKQAEDERDRVFLHRGIAARQFQRSFVLADGVEVAGAATEHGLLHIDLRRAVPDSVVQTIKINNGGAT
jgi:HSP20 family molecular chaperone IbpA